MDRREVQHRPVVAPGRFLLARALVGLLAATLIGLQGAWLGERATLLSGLVLAGWLSVTTLVWRPWLGPTGRSWWNGPAVVAMLLGDCGVIGAVVRAAGALHSPMLLLLALPVLGGAMLYQVRLGLLLGLTASLIYGLLGLEDAGRGMLPGALWSLIALHSLLFVSMGLAAGLLGRQMASSLREADETRSELAVVRLSTDRLVEAITCGLIAVDRSGAVRSLNAEARRLLELGPGAEGETDLLEGWEGCNPPLAALLRDGLERPRPVEAEVTLLGPGGSAFPAWVKLSPVVDDAGGFHGLVGLFWDLTERKASEELDRHRERLAMVGELSAGLAHEIRNSLKPITGSIELLQSRMQSTPQTAPLLELITREAASLEAFLSQFLRLARDKTLKLEEIDLEDLIEDEARALRVGRGASESSGRVVVSGPGGPRLIGDREWLRQVFRNVILNAVEADPAGRVEARIERFERAGRPWLRARIIDGGPGLAEIDPREAFLPFRTTKSGGSGLGLPIAQRGVEEHGGRIAFDPGWSGGGCVVIELPERRPLSESDAGGRAA